MPLKSDYLFIASMDVDPNVEARFNQLYDQEHIPLIAEVPGVLSVSRFKLDELTFIVGGQSLTVKVEGQPNYSAFYEVEDPKVLTSREWAKAVDRGRWPTEVRPHTRNRKHMLMRRINP